MLLEMDPVLAGPSQVALYSGCPMAALTLAFNWKNRVQGVRRTHPAPTGHNSIQGTKGTATAYVCFVKNQV